MRRVFLRRLGLLAALGLAGRAEGGPLLERLREMRDARRGDADEGEMGEDRGAGRRSFTPPAGVEVERDLAYGSDPAQRLDVYRKPGSEGAPVLFMVHGGGWRFGDKAMSNVVQNKIQRWVMRGWVLVSVNYRLVPDAYPLEQAEDVGRALAFAQGRAKQWGADPSRFVLMGHSAGAHIVSLMNADDGMMARHGAQRWMATVSLDSAAFDVEAIMDRRHYAFYDKVFGSDREMWRRVSPTLRLKSAPPAPMLLVCSSRRSDSCDPAREFADKANGFGGRVTVLPLDRNHGQINQELGSAGEYTEKVESFLRSAGLT